MPDIPHIDRPAPADRLRVGEAIVVLSTREIHMPGARRPQRVTPKAIGVLRMLADHAGRPVGRNDLLAMVWAGTLPTDDVVTQAVTQLRKAFAAGTDASVEGKRYIETIAKNGYRLAVPLEWLPDAPAETTPPPSVLPADADADTGQPAAPTVRRRFRGAHAAGVMVALLAVATVAIVLVRAGQVPALAASAPVIDAGAAGPARPYRLITSTPGFELSPSLSPDASMVAYAASVAGRSGTVIMLQTTTHAPPRQLADPGADASDGFPAWSPDGREIAFARAWNDGRCRVMVATANGGSEREVAQCDRSELLSFDWTPDGGGLVFGTMSGVNAGPGIRILDLASGRWRSLDYDISHGDFDYAPRYSPDGRWIAFVRNPQLGDLWRVPAAGGRAEPLTELGAEIRGWSWLPDSRSLVFGRRVDSQSRLYRLDTASGEVRDLGLEDAQAPVVSPTGMLAFVHRRPRFAIYRIDPSATAEDGSVAREHLFESFGRDTQPIVSPDGTHLVFTSDRSGSFELWHADLSRPGSLRPIEGVRAETRQAPAWSPDGRRLLVAGWDSVWRPSIFEVVPETGQAERLPVPLPRPLQAAYLPDPARLLVVADAGAGQMQLVLYDRSRTPWRPLRVIDDVSQVRLDAPRRRVLFTRLSGSGLWQIDPDLDPASARPVDPTAPSRWRYRTWAVSGDGGIDYLHPSPDCRSRLTRIGEGRSGRTVCLDPDRLSSTNVFSIDPRSGRIYAALAAEDGTDIGFMAVPGEPASTLRRVAKWLISLGKVSS